MVVYYHGTSSTRERSVDQHGLCPPSECPSRDFPLRRCVEDAVYVTTDLEDAVMYAEAEATNFHGKPIVYAVTKLPKSCKPFLDPELEEIGTAFILEKCGCIRASKKCHVNESGFCTKWVKV